MFLILVINLWVGMRRRGLKRDAEFLLDVLLSSVNPEKVDDRLGWRLAELAKADKLSTREGLDLLLRAVKACEPEKLRDVV